MNRTIATLATLATLATIPACDAPDTGDAEPRSKVLHSDAASLAALAEADTEVLDQMAAQLDMSGDALLARALDPEAYEDMSLTNAPRPALGESCVGITDEVEFCWEKSGGGYFFWVKAFGINGPKHYGSQHGACTSGGFKEWGTGATYTVCYLEIPFKHFIVAAEACFLGDCADYGKAIIL